MFRTGFILLCSLAILVSGIADGRVGSSDAVDSTGSTTDNSSRTSFDSPRTSSTIPDVTTVAPSTTTTPAPSTTTPAPSTTPPAPSPTPTPSPIPPTPGTPPTGRWVVNGTNVTCIIAKMALQFNVTYVDNDNKTVNRALNLPANNETWANGTCGKTDDLEQNLTISWNSTIPSETSNNLILHFVKNVTSKRWALGRLEVKFSRAEFPGIETNTTKFVHAGDAFSAEIGNSYRCLKNQRLNLTTVDNKSGGEICISDLQFQAFHEQDSTSFGYAEDCAFDTPDIVPIAVGCALAILVVIVLAAYLVGRRRSQARGYLSM